jgi:hypothetical protein
MFKGDSRIVFMFFNAVLTLTELLIYPFVLSMTFNLTIHENKVFDRR